MRVVEKRRIFAERVLKWHRAHARDLPWRKTRDPYAVLVSEVLLQRTTAGQVLEIYEPFLARYPSTEALATAPLEEVEEFIGHLGLKKRARRLKEIALRIESRYGGEIPSDAEELLDLPGVGKYAANAVLCFAFGKDLPVVDDSVIRVITRVFSVEASTSRPRQDRAIWNFVARMIPKGRSKEFAWGLLDFAAEICTARNPKHDECPVSNLCDHYRTIS